MHIDDIFVSGRWYFVDIDVSFTNKTDHHDIKCILVTVIILKTVSTSYNLTPTPYSTTHISYYLNPTYKLFFHHTIHIHPIM